MTRPTLLRLLAAGTSLFLAAWTLAAPASTGPEGERLPWRTVELKERRYVVEVATTLAQQQRGLQGRTSLKAGHGMLFVYDTPGTLSFWMKDTRIPLDILFFDSRGRLVNVHHAVPPCPPRTFLCPTYTSRGPARYALELQAGQAQGLAVKPGDSLRLLPLP